MKSYQLVVPDEFMRFLKIEAAKATITVKEFIMTAVHEKAERMEPDKTVPPLKSEMLSEGYEPTVGNK